MPAGRRATVCLFSSYPLLFSEFERRLFGQDFRLLCRRLEPERAPDLRRLRVPRASVYVVEAYARRQVTDSLVAAIVGRYPFARLLVLAEKFTQECAFSLLERGVRGFLKYSEVAYLPRALREVAAGGSWVPRALLTRFVDLTRDLPPQPLVVPGPEALSRREREVAELLLANFSNKQIASRLDISERTAKFHVSNLLAKYGVKRRANVILLSFAQPKPVGVGSWLPSKLSERIARWNPGSVVGGNEVSVRANRASRLIGGNGEQRA